MITSVITRGDNNDKLQTHLGRPDGRYVIHPVCRARCTGTGIHPFNEKQPAGQTEKPAEKPVHDYYKEKVFSFYSPEAFADRIKDPTQMDKPVLYVCSIGDGRFMPATHVEEDKETIRAAATSVQSAYQRMVIFNGQGREQLVLTGRMVKERDITSPEAVYDYMIKLNKAVQNKSDISGSLPSGVPEMMSGPAYHPPMNVVAPYKP